LHFGDTSGVGLQADGNHNNIVDAADYATWRKYLGRSSIGYSFNSIGQTHTQNFNFFQGLQPSLPKHFTFIADSGTNIFRGVFNSTTSSAPSFTGIMAATSDGVNHSVAWRESTGSASLADGRMLFALTNNTGQPITAFNYSYDVEAWVNGRRDNQVRFKYDVYANDPAAQTAAGRDAFLTDIAATINPNHTPIANNTDEFVRDGKAAANRVTVSGTVDLTTLLIDTATPGLGTFGALQPGQTAYFRWQISNANLNNGNRSALGLDNFALTPLAAAGQGTGIDSEATSSAPTSAALPPDDSHSLVLESFAYMPPFHGRRVPTSGLPNTTTVPSFENLLLLADVKNDANHSYEATPANSYADEPPHDFDPDVGDPFGVLELAFEDLM
jgi:hypothetical protein